MLKNGYFILILFQVKMEQNKNETRRNLDQRNEYEMKYRKKADRVNEFKEALRDVYKHNITLEAALKTVSSLTKE